MPAAICCGHFYAEIQISLKTWNAMTRSLSLHLQNLKV